MIMTLGNYWLEEEMDALPPVSRPLLLTVTCGREAEQSYTFNQAQQTPSFHAGLLARSGSLQACGGLCSSHPILSCAMNEQTYGEL